MLGLSANYYLRFPIQETRDVRVKIAPNSITAEDLQTQLSSQFPSWSFKQKGNKKLFVVNDRNVGLNITVRKSAIILESRFAKTGHQVFFVIMLIATGVIIPLSVYAIIFGKRMRAMRKTVAGAVASPVA